MTTDTQHSDSLAARLTALLAPIHDRAQMTARRLCRSDAEGDDVFQDAALRALTRLPELRDEAAFPAWFYRILVSVHRTRTRRGFWRRLLPLDAATPGGELAGEDGAARIERRAERREGGERLRHALSRLPAEQREAVVLFEIEDRSLREICEIQGASLSAVKSRLARGRERLRKHYRRAHAAEPAEARASTAALVKTTDIHARAAGESLNTGTR